MRGGNRNTTLLSIGIMRFPNFDNGEPTRPRVKRRAPPPVAFRAPFVRPRFYGMRPTSGSSTRSRRDLLDCVRYCAALDFPRSLALPRTHARLQIPSHHQRIHQSMKSRIARFFSVAALTFAFGAGVTAAPLADFTLPEANGPGKFTLSEARGKFVALHFLLKTECPVCLRHTRDYSQKSKQLKNVIQVFIKPDSAEEIRQWSAKVPESKEASLAIYRDADAKLAKTLKIPDGYEFHGQVVHYPALILINPQGKEIFRYIGKNNSDRYPFEDLKKKIETHSKPK
jgi:thioredoxin-dependent peroxiredoxin